MIDTIKLQIPIDEYLYAKMGKEHYQHQVTLGSTGEHAKEMYYGGLPFGNKGSEVRFTARFNSLQTFGNSYSFYLEFSLPKYVYLHNVYLYYPDKIVDLLRDLRAKLNAHFQVVFPELNEWVIQRLDLCYAWRLPSQEFSLSLLQALRGYSYPRKKLVLHDTTITHQGTSYSVMFYLKHNEYVAKGYKDVARLDPIYAEIVRDESVGVLRFEVRLQKQKLNSLFRGKKDRLRVSELANRALLFDLLNTHFSILIRSTDIKIDPIFVIQDKLKSVYGVRKARELFLFYQSYFGSLESRENVVSVYDKSSINRKLKDLSSAGVGLTMVDSPIASLSIPSEFVVNQDNIEMPEILTEQAVITPVQNPLIPMTRSVYDEAI